MESSVVLVLCHMMQGGETEMEIIVVAPSQSGTHTSQRPMELLGRRTHRRMGVRQQLTFDPHVGHMSHVSLRVGGEAGVLSC